MVTLPEINPWTVGDRVAMGVDIQILEKSLCKRINRRNYLQFSTVHQLRAAVSYVYSATSTAHDSRYPLESHWGSVLHMYEGDMQLAFTGKYFKGIKRRIPEYSDLNKTVNSVVVNYILNNVEHEWVMPNTEPSRNRELLMTAA